MASAAICCLLAAAVRAAVDRDEAVRIAREIPAVNEALNGLRATPRATPPANRRRDWEISFFLPGDDQPAIGLSVNADTKETHGLWWNPETFRLNHRKSASPWDQLDFASLRTEDPLVVVREVGNQLRLRPYLARFPDARLHAEYAPEANCWVVTVHRRGETLGYVLYAEGQIRKIVLEDYTLPPSPPEPTRGEEAGRAALPSCTLGLLALLVGILLFANPRKLRGAPAWQLAALLAPFILLPPLAVDWMFAAAICLAVVIMVTVVRAAKEGPSVEVDAGLVNTRGMALIAVTLCVLSFASLATKQIGDASSCAAIGARYLLQEHHLPYGSDISSTGYIANDRNTYGPLIYLAHVPMEAALPTTYQAQGVRSVVGSHGWSVYFVRMTLSDASPRCTALALWALLLPAVFLIGRRAGGIRTAWGCVSLSAFIPLMANGTSGHIVTSAALLWAVVFLDRPFLCGSLLTLAAFGSFYPAFAVPLWMGWQRRSGKFWPFVAGVAVTGVVMTGLMFLLSPQQDVAGALNAFVRDTVLVQEGASGFAASKVTFWGQHPALRLWIQHPLIVLYLLGCVAAAFLPRIRDPRGLLALTVILFAGTAFWKSMGPLYVDWYFFLALFVFCWPRGATAGPNERLASAAPL